jgi:glutamine amidotransferase
MVDVAVIDYGVGNLLSVCRALAHCGVNVVVTSDHDKIYSAQRVVLPGVGAFSNAMQSLREYGLDKVVRNVANSGKSLLGICLGMQMLMDGSEEFGETDGLGLIPGRVVAIPLFDTQGKQLKIPHIGWNDLIPADGCTTWHGSALEGISPGEAVYFVHSFMSSPVIEEHRLADCLVGGHRVCAAVQRGNIQGLQFHPEKSGSIGLMILKKFCANHQ